MPPPSSKPLTERQLAVMVRVDRRVPIKVIAQELGVSETRINQHIRALKNIFDVASLGELVERYRASLPADAEDADAQSSKDQTRVAEAGLQDSTVFPLPKTTVTEVSSGLAGLSEAVYSKNQVPSTAENDDQLLRDDLGKLEINDVMPMVQQAPWLRSGEPKVVPGVLDGDHATLFRLGAIIVIAFGFLAAVVLMVTAAMTISEALEGKATIPAETQG